LKRSRGRRPAANTSVFGPLGVLTFVSSWRRVVVSAEGIDSAGADNQTL
jgi:hypothetical protein